MIYTRQFARGGREKPKLSSILVRDRIDLSGKRERVCQPLQRRLMRPAFYGVSAGEHNQYWERHNCLHLDRTSPAMRSACLVKLNSCCSISALAGCCGPLGRGRGFTPVSMAMSDDFSVLPWTSRGVKLMFLELYTQWPFNSLSAFLKHTPTACLGTGPFLKVKLKY